MKKPNTDALASRIADRIIRFHERMANYLNRKTAYWDRSSKMMALLAFCLLFGSICLYLIIKVFY